MGSSWTCCSWLTTTPGQPLDPSLPGQCWESCSNPQGVRWSGFFKTYFYWKIIKEPFLAISSVKIILDMLFPTYHGPWPTLEGILVRELKRNLQFWTTFCVIHTVSEFYGKVWTISTWLIIQNAVQNTKPAQANGVKCTIVWVSQILVNNMSNGYSVSHS